MTLQMTIKKPLTMTIGHLFSPAEIEQNRPFRVAISNDDRIYSGHTEVRDYADYTVGYAYDLNHAAKLLAEAHRIL